MRLLKVKKKDPLLTLINNLEKIGKIAAIRIEKDYTDSVIEDLKWIEDNFIDVLKLYNSDKDLFFQLIDPNNRYRIVKHTQQDLSDFDFQSFFGEVQQVDENLPQQRSYEKLYKSYDNPDKGNDLILRYISSIFNIWNAANQKKNFLVQKYSLYIFTNWVYILDPLKDSDFNYQGILRYFLDNLTNLNVSTLNIEENQLHPLSSLLNYNIYLNKIFSEDVNPDNIDVYFEYLFKNLYQTLRHQKATVVKFFIERCIDSTFYPSGTSYYSTLYSSVLNNLREKEQADYTELLKPIPRLASYSIRYINTFDQLKTWTEEFDTYLVENIFNKIEKDDAINQQIVLIKKLAIKTLKFNKLQITVLKLLTYSLFKSDKIILDHAFEYNQPNDSNAIQGNKEILPSSLSEILNLIKDRYIIEHELFPYWEGHHGVEFYLDQLFLILLDRYRPSRFYQSESPKSVVVGFCRDALKDDAGAVDALDHYITRLASMFEKLSEIEPYKTDFFRNGIGNDRTKILFQDINDGLKSVMNVIEITGTIKDETKSRFIANIISEYGKYNFLLQLFKKYATEHDVQDNLRFDSVGINELIDRTAFVENWHIPYVGLIEGRGKDMAEQENRYGQFTLIKKIKDENKITINANNVSKILKEYSNGNFVVIVRNLQLDFLLGDDDEYKPNWKDKNAQAIIPNFHIGFFNKTPVFRLYDDLFNDSLLIIKKSAIIKVIEQTGEIIQPFQLVNHFKTSFIDLSLEDEYKTELITKPPMWLNEQFGQNKDQLKSFLQKKIWLRILKKTAFQVADEPDCYLYELVKTKLPR